jgi:hypothetical protein
MSGKVMGSDSSKVVECGRREAKQQDRDPFSEDERVVEEFYRQLWDWPCEKHSGKGKCSPILIWVKRELVERGSFTEGDCSEIYSSVYGRGVTVERREKTFGSVEEVLDD